MTEFFQGADPRTRSIVLAGLAGIAIGVAVGIIIPAGLGWDFAVFYDAGRRALHGQFRDLYDPFSAIAGKRPQGEMRFWVHRFQHCYMRPWPSFLRM